MRNFAGRDNIDRQPVAHTAGRHPGTVQREHRGAAGRHTEVPPVAVQRAQPAHRYGDQAQHRTTVGAIFGQLGKLHPTGKLAGTGKAECFRCHCLFTHFFLRTLWCSLKLPGH